jgi:hypothetical protein
MSDLTERLRLGPPYDIEEGISLLDEAATEIEALRRENQELIAERGSARNDEWLAAISAVQYMVANWQQDCRTPESLKALIDAGEDIVSALKQAGPTEYLDMKWKGAQEALAAEEVARELRADCQRKDELLTAAVDDYNEARSLAIEECAKVADDHDTGGYGLYKNMAVSQEVSRDIATAIRALAMSDIHREQLDRPRREIE